MGKQICILMKSISLFSFAWRIKSWLNIWHYKEHLQHFSEFNTLIFVIIIAENSDLHEYTVSNHLSTVISEVIGSSAPISRQNSLDFFFLNLKSATQTENFKTKNSNAAIQRYINLIFTCWRMIKAPPIITSLCSAQQNARLYSQRAAIRNITVSIWAGGPRQHSSVLPGIAAGTRQSICRGFQIRGAVKPQNPTRKSSARNSSGSLRVLFLINVWSLCIHFAIAIVFMTPLSVWNS